MGLLYRESQLLIVPLRYHTSTLRLATQVYATVETAQRGLRAAAATHTVHLLIQLTNNEQCQALHLQLIKTTTRSLQLMYALPAQKH